MNQAEQSVHALLDTVRRLTEENRQLSSQATGGALLIDVIERIRAANSPEDLMRLALEPVACRHGLAFALFIRWEGSHPTVSAAYQQPVTTLHQGNVVPYLASKLACEGLEPRLFRCGDRDSTPLFEWLRTAEAPVKNALSIPLHLAAGETGFLLLGDTRDPGTLQILAPALTHVAHFIAVLYENTRLLRALDAARTELDTRIEQRTRTLLEAFRRLQEEMIAREQAAAAFQESQRRLHIVASSVPVLLWAVDRAGLITLFEGRALESLRLRPGQPVGRSVFELYREHHDLLNAVRQCLQGQEITLLHDISPLTLESRLLPRRDTTGSIRGLVAVSLDVTERRRAESERRRLEGQVEQAQKLESLGVLAGGIAHDFNNLLTAILGNTTLALEDLADDSPTRHNLLDIQESTRRAADLCKQMLAYSGRGRFLLEPVHLPRLVQQMDPLLRASISKKAQLELHLVPSVPTVEADASQLRQVVMNLIMNASEALADREGTIRIRVHEEHCDAIKLSQSTFNHGSPGPYVALSIEDTGCGIDPANRARVFEPFYTTKFTGRGLGLSAVLGIVRGHQGAITLTSSTARGTNVSVFLPVSGRKTEPAPAPSPSPASWQGRGTLLLVDDEEAVRRLGQRVLERAGFSVVTAQDGAEGVEIFTRDPRSYRCVILDLTMPRMDGQEALRRLREIRPDIPVLLASGFSQQELCQRFAGQRVDGFIEKPYETALLIAKVRQAIDPTTSPHP